jgi:hypothetical protein
VKCADRLALMAQINAESPVTFLPALYIYAVTRWQEVRDVWGDTVTFASSEFSLNCGSIEAQLRRN